MRLLSSGSLPFPLGDVWVYSTPPVLFMRLCMSSTLLLLVVKCNLGHVTFSFTLNKVARQRP